ncbi:MAG: hypothetical protein D6767_05770 [Candidatus Hydrogenedentota bacterium]|nr:MAG: hypothetical protein D6767_05770 [Candidatus Hydrogenedentota bacterium]
MFHRKPKKIGSLSYQASRLLKKEKEKTEIFREFLDKPKFTDVLIELNRIIKTDPNMKIHEIHYANNQLNLTGTTDSFQSLSTVKKELKKAENCKEANFAREKTAPGSGGKTIVKFTLVCKIKDEA